MRDFAWLDGYANGAGRQAEFIFSRINTSI